MHNKEALYWMNYIPSHSLFLPLKPLLIITRATRIIFYFKQISSFSSVCLLNTYFFHVTWYFQVWGIRPWAFLGGHALILASTTHTGHIQYYISINSSINPNILCVTGKWGGVSSDIPLPPFLGGFVLLERSLLGSRYSLLPGTTCCGFIRQNKVV